MGLSKYNRPIIIGHRANSGRIILYYKLSKVEYVEADITASPRGPIVLHGPSDIERASKIGKVFAAIDYLLFYRDPIINPTTLDSWLKKVSWTRGVLLDVKPNIDPNDLISAIEKSGFTGHILFASKDHEYLFKLKQRFSKAVILATIEEKLIKLSQYIKEVNADGISAKYTILDNKIIKELKNINKLVFAWTVNSPDKALELIKKGVDGIITDRPDVIKKYIKINNK